MPCSSIRTGEFWRRFSTKSRPRNTNQGHGMLSAIVVHATDDYLPGPGFFKLADTLGLAASDKIAFHAAELHRVHDAHVRA